MFSKIISSITKEVAEVQRTPMKPESPPQKVAQVTAFPEANPIAKWLDFWANQDLINSVSEVIAGEKLLRIYTNKDPIDYGYSFPGLNIIRQSCLEAVRNFCEAEGQPAVVADLGAGFGNMTWKLLAAGALVEAFELNETAARSIKKRIRTMNPAFWGEKPLDGMLRVFIANILAVLSKKELRQKYDFIWIGNVFHFLNPDEAKHISKLLHLILKPGGKVFIETNSIETFLNQPFENNHLLTKALARAKAKNAEFPGFMAINSATLINRVLNQVVRYTQVAAFDQYEMASLSIPPKTNAYGKGLLAPLAFNSESREIVESFQQECDDVVAMNSFHLITNLLDETTSQRMFKQAGFSQVKTTTLAIGDKSRTHQGLNVIAQKPFIAPDERGVEINDRTRTPQENDEPYVWQTLNGQRSLLVDERPSLAFRRPYSLSIFAPQSRTEDKMELVSFKP